MLIATLFIIAYKQKQPKCPTTAKWIIKQYIHTIKYYLAIKRSEVLIHATMWLHLENIMLSERSQQKRTHMV